VGRRWSRGDFTYDGVANLDDFDVIAAKFGTVIAGASADTTSLPRGSSVRSTGSPFGGSSIGDD
jgi:hypothetical protein